MKNKHYQDQAKDIEAVAQSIIEKSKAFAKRNLKSQYYGDLLHVLEGLQELDKFLK